ncbi:hypothetical protein E8E13_010969 [Curvularia kusanoi]|uniref:Uncharacterized protein n=1 Tax=Curvularia kusanoi TaxID=90978 RepID=A0A9P4W8W6_CURKU|nr:hypothetical protein E8E13_010969 [Curvularia kusanoi]
MAEPGASSIVAQSETSAVSTEQDTEPIEANEPPVTQVRRLVRPGDSHQCPLHGDPEDCFGNWIKPEDEEISSTLIEPKITFYELDEQLREKTRDQSKLLPSTLYRTFYEGSATLSSRVSKDTHVRHRQNKVLKLRQGNAFQTVGEVKFNKHVNKEGIQRHLVWNKKKDPSAWISMFSGLSHAKRRAEFHYNESQRIGQRVTIAGISTAGLVAATLHADCRTVWKIQTRGKYYGKDEVSSITTRKVAIPVWVSRSACPVDGSSIKAEQLMASHADLFVSIEELRHSNLVEGPDSHCKRRTIHAHGHNYEWLALGRIREDRIVKVIPYDGRAFHMTKPSYTVRSEDATDNWVFDFGVELWRLESQMNPTIRKRKAGEVITNIIGAGGEDNHKHKKINRQVLDLSPIKTVYASV